MSYDRLYFCVVCCDLSIFISGFIDWFSPFASWWAWLIVNFIYPFKEPAFGFVDFCYGLFCFCCLYFCPNFKDFFPSTKLGFFISSFSSCFRCRVRLFIWLFSCFLRYACIARNLSLITAFTVSHRFWVVVLSFSFVSMHILIYSFISSVICWLFSSMLFSLYMLEFLIVFLL